MLIPACAAGSDSDGRAATETTWPEWSDKRRTKFKCSLLTTRSDMPKFGGLASPDITASNQGGKNLDNSLEVRTRERKMY